MNENFGTELCKLMKKYKIESIESPVNAYSKIYVSEDYSGIHILGFRFNGKNLKAEEVLGDDVYLIFNLENQHAENRMAN